MNNKTLSSGDLALDAPQLALDPGCAALQEAALQVWTPGLHGSVGMARRQLDNVTLVLTDEPTGDWAMSLDEALVLQEIPSILVVVRQDQLWLHLRRHPRHAPCLACLAAQAELLPWTALPRPVPDSGPALVQLLLQALASEAASQADDWTLLRSSASGVQFSTQLLKDPICTVCSAVARRPNQVYFHEELSHV